MDALNFHSEDFFEPSEPAHIIHSYLLKTSISLYFVLKDNVEHSSIQWEKKNYGHSGFAPSFLLAIGTKIKMKLYPNSV